MKKRLIFVLLLSMPVRAADLLENFSDYTYMLRKVFHQDSANTDFLDDTTAHDFVRLSVVSLMPVLRADKAVFLDSTIIFQSIYLLDSTLLGIYAIEWFNVDSIKVLDHVPMALWKQHFLELSKESQKPLARRPYFYDYTDDTLFLFPTPIKTGDDFRIIAWRKVPSIAAVDSLANIPQKFRPPILHYAAWLVARARQHPLLAEYRASYMESMRFVLQSNYNLGGAPVEEAP